MSRTCHSAWWAVHVASSILKAARNVEEGIFKTVIYSVSIYIVIRKVALNKAKHHFAYIFFITNILLESFVHEFDLWNEEMLFQSRFLSYFVGFTFTCHLFLSLSFPTFYSVHLCSCVNQPLRVEVCVFPSLCSSVFISCTCCPVLQLFLMCPGVPVPFWFSLSLCVSWVLFSLPLFPTLFAACISILFQLCYSSSPSVF